MFPMYSFPIPAYSMGLFHNEIYALQVVEIWQYNFLIDWEFEAGKVIWIWIWIWIWYLGVGPGRDRLAEKEAAVDDGYWVKR